MPRTHSKMIMPGFDHVCRNEATPHAQAWQATSKRAQASAADGRSTWAAERREARASRAAHAMRLVRLAAGASLSSVSTKTGLGGALAGVRERARLAAFLAGGGCRAAPALPPTLARSMPRFRSVLTSARNALSSDKM